MQYYGTIIRWNENRNFGTIQEDSTQAEVFAPISSFRLKNPPPSEGERVSFELVSGRRGRGEAQNVRYPERFRTSPYPQYPQEKSNIIPILFSIICILSIIAGSYFFFQHWQHNRHAQLMQQESNMVEKVANQMQTEQKEWQKALQQPRTLLSNGKEVEK